MQKVFQLFDQHGNPIEEGFEAITEGTGPVRKVSGYRYVVPQQPTVVVPRTGERDPYVPRSPSLVDGWLPASLRTVPAPSPVQVWGTRGRVPSRPSRPHVP
jgi:hypothetical protein